jgi:hypothetical protein
MFDNTAAGVACKELGFSQYGMLSKLFDITSMFQTYHYTIMCVGSIAASLEYYNRRIASAIHSVQCRGSEEILLDCQHNNGSSTQCHGIVAYVICRGKNYNTIVITVTMHSPVGKSTDYSCKCTLAL